MKSNGKITPPCDAEGREIPLDTKVLYDKNGEKLCVKHAEFDPFSKKWCFITTRDPVSWNNIYFNPESVYLVKPNQPDSWEKLLEDLDHASKGGDNAECLYMRRDCMEVQCPGCRLEDNESDDIECSYLVFADIAARIRKLRGKE